MLTLKTFLFEINHHKHLELTVYYTTLNEQDLDKECDNKLEYKANVVCDAADDFACTDAIYADSLRRP